MEGFEYMGGLPKAALTDRMKTVLLDMDGKTPIWHPRFADFMASIGVSPRVCKSYTPQTKGKVERSVGVIKYNFWPGVHFTDLDDFNQQGTQWCNRLNQQVHRTTRARPMDRSSQEPFAPLPAAFAWECFPTEDRKVSWDGYLSYDGVLYGLSSEPPLAGSTVQVRDSREGAHDLVPWPACDDLDEACLLGRDHLPSRSISHGGFCCGLTTSSRTFGAPGGGS